METSAVANLAGEFGTNVHTLKLCLTFWVRGVLDVAKWQNSGFVLIWLNQEWNYRTLEMEVNWMHSHDTGCLNIPP